MIDIGNLKRLNEEYSKLDSELNSWEDHYEEIMEGLDKISDEINEGIKRVILYNKGIFKDYIFSISQVSGKYSLSSKLNKNSNIYKILKMYKGSVISIVSAEEDFSANIYGYETDEYLYIQIDTGFLKFINKYNILVEMESSKEIKASLENYINNLQEKLTLLNKISK